MPPITAPHAITAWVFEPVSAVCIVVLAVAYLAGRRRVGRWPVARTVFFLAGLAAWALLTMSFVGAYDSTLFLVRAVQTVLLLMVVPLFLALGMPLTLLMRALPEQAASRARSIGHSRPAQVFTFPAVISVALLATPFAFFFTGWFTAALHGGIANDLTHLWLVGVGWAYYWTRVQVDPVPHVYPPLVSMWITFAEVIFDGGLGLILMLSSHVVALEHWQAVRSWGPTPLTDQQLGGAAFWILGDLSGLPFLGALFRKMVRDDEEHSAAIDRELDALDAARRRAAIGSSQPAASSGAAGRAHVDGVPGAALAAEAASPGAVSASGRSGAEDDDGLYAPWWELDPSRLRR